MVIITCDYSVVRLSKLIHWVIARIEVEGYYSVESGLIGKWIVLLS